MKSYIGRVIDRTRMNLIQLLAGKRSVLFNVKIIGSGNSIKMTDPALIMNVSLDASEPAEDSAVIIEGIA